MSPCDFHGGTPRKPELSSNVEGQTRAPKLAFHDGCSSWTDCRSLMPLRSWSPRQKPA